MSWALPALSLLSGMAALVYETVWLRWFRLLFGSTAYAASATLCAFFAGLALGAYLFGRRAGAARRPLLLYGAIELGAALAALVVPLFTWAYEPIYGSLYATLSDEGGVFVAVKFLLALFAIVPAATLLGGTLPALAAAYVADPATLGRRAGTLYAINTLGAALGSALGALWLPDVIGVRATYGVAISLSAVVAAIAFALARLAPAERERTHEAVTRAAGAPRHLLAVSFASGFGTLAFEVLLIHAVALHVQSSVYSFGAVLIVVLTTLALAAALAAVSAGRIDASALLGTALVVEAVLLVTLPGVMVWMTGGIGEQLPAHFGSGMWLALRLGAPALLVAGLVLPLTFRLAEGGAVGPRVGGLLAANTLGGITGSVAGSFLLLDRLGLYPSIALVGLFYGAVAAVAVVPVGTGGARWRLAPVAVVGVVALAVGLSPANPYALSPVRLQPGERLVAVAEGAHGVVSVTEFATKQFEIERVLRVDNDYLLAGALAETHQRRMGHLPLLLRPDARRVLFVGSATGETSSSALQHPVDEVVLVELVPEVQQLAAEYFREANRGVYDDARTRVVVEDGRNHLRGAPEKYDVVVTDLFVPSRPGVGAMYSLEHFRAVRDHLTEGGVFCLWIPVYQHDLALFRSVVATFLEVFPDATLWRSDFFVGMPAAAFVGIAGEPPTVDEVNAAVRALQQQGVEDRWVVDPAGFWMFYLGPLAGIMDMTGAVPNTDDRPDFEYHAARMTAAGLAEFRLSHWPAITTRAIAAAGDPDPVFPGRPVASARGGVAWARAGRLLLSEGESRLAEARKLVVDNVPQPLLTGPDKTVSEVWPLVESTPSTPKWSPDS